MMPYVIKYDSIRHRNEILEYSWDLLYKTSEQYKFNKEHKNDNEDRDNRRGFTEES